MFDLRCQTQHVQSDFHVHIPLHPALAGFGVGKLAGQLADHRIAVIVKPVDQGAEW